MKCCGSVLFIVCIPTCFTSKPGILPSRRSLDRLLRYLSSASDRTPWKTNAEHHFRSAHWERNLKLYEILQIFYTKIRSHSKISCCMLGRVLRRLIYIMSLIHGKHGHFLLYSRGIWRAVFSLGSLFSLISFVIHRSERLLFFYKGDNWNQCLKGCLDKPASLH